jgi:tetratricopeptide (TPR) repeat protein
MSKSTRKRKGEEIASLYPIELETYLSTGYSNYKLGKFREAIDSFEKVTKIDPNHIKTHFYLGHSNLRLSKFSEATKHFEKVIDLNPKYIDAYYALGGIYFKLGNFPEVIKNFGELIKLKPTHDEAHQVLGRSYLKINDFDNAIMHFTKAVSLNPLKFTDCYLTSLAKIKNPGFKNLTTISKSLQQVIASNKTILKGTADESTLSKVNFNIAEALAFLHKLGFSEESEFLKHAADYYFRCGTVVALEKIINHDPQDTLKLHYKAHYERGNIAFTNKDYNTALSYYQQVLKVMPSFIDAYIHASLSCIEIGKNGDGISILISERSSWYLSQS